MQSDIVIGRAWQLIETTAVVLIMIAWFATAARYNGKNVIVSLIVGALSYLIPRYVASTVFYKIVLYVNRTPPNFSYIQVIHLASIIIGLACCWSLRHYLMPRRNPNTNVGERFWHGPIQTRAAAQTIIKWAGWIFVGFGAGELTIHSLVKGTPDIGDLILALILLAPPILLLTKESTNTAMIVFFLALIFLVGSVVGDIYLISQTGIKFLPTGVSMFVVSLILTLLSWRAVVAAKALAGLTGSTTAAPVSTPVDSHQAILAPAAEVRIPTYPVPAGFTNGHRRLRPDEPVFHPNEGEGIVIGPATDGHFVRVRFSNHTEKTMETFGLYAKI
jgi:hypothetical protein